ncbi:MAG TPA: hypothetical protein VMR06_07175 [Dokdonella sp.]|uniref:hypothetical protein n=1 Tax=Dokdonella sp. TaxID=2291710 RepID=UPI002BFDFE02|nr:hypothetical protein [Dokdonella sp.]HUD41767.1 hypothetical protein [Dokdonella sp.]
MAHDGTLRSTPEPALSSAIRLLRLSAHDVPSLPCMSSVSTARPGASASRALGLATALMCALAAGAIWCVLTLYTGRDLSALAVAIGLILAAVLRAHDYAGTATGAILAVICTLAACFYAQYLLATAQIASLLGLPMGMALTKIGPDMALAVIKTRVGAWDAALMAGSAAVAGILTASMSRKRL